MRIVLVLLLSYYSVSAFATDPVRKIAQANKAKELASKAFGTGDYATAIEQYNFLIDSLGYEDEALILNRAHAYFQSKDTLRALDNYRAASMAEQPAIQATAFSQLGVLSEQKQQPKEALSYYKEALRADPTNQEARYNYELLKKKLQEQEQQKEQNKDQDQKGQDKDQQDKKEQQDKQEGDKSKGDSEEDKSEGEDDKSEAEEGDKKEQQDQQKGKEQEGKDQEGEQKEGEQKEGEQSEGESKSEQEQKAKEGEEMKPSTSEKLKAMNVSQEKAKQILEALRNKEAQYLQQNRKKATQKEDKGKPDW